jgi:hypothetical protein
MQRILKNRTLNKAENTFLFHPIFCCKKEHVFCYETMQYESKGSEKGKETGWGEWTRWCIFFTTAERRKSLVWGLCPTKSTLQENSLAIGEKI